MTKYLSDLVCILALLLSITTPVSVSAKRDSLPEYPARPANVLQPSTQPLQNAMLTATGGAHVCMTTTTGEVFCWGDNRYGQLGDGTTTNRFVPVASSNLTGVKAIAAGYWHTCVLLVGGTVQCWGYNRYGQLGDSSTTNRPNPVPVVGLAGEVTAISAGRYHTCAVLLSGAAQCWGYNFSGQLGDGDNLDRFTAVNVVGLTSGAAGISAGYRHTCALLTSGAVQCWGNNMSGGLGDGTTTERFTPVDVAGLAGAARSISAGRDSTCALLVSGAAQCWGDNRYGQLGDGTVGDRLSPVSLSVLTGGIKAISAGYYHTCALLDTETVHCWGYNRYGELGDSTTIDHLTPAAVGLAGPASAIAAGYYSTCAVLVAGTVQCWGNNFSGQLGNGFQHGYSPIPVETPGLLADQVTLGAYHTCALLTSGVVQCWGNNGSGQLGDGTTTDRLMPVTVAGLADAILALAAGEDHTCALSTAGGVQCWGRNDKSQLGDGTITNRPTPLAVNGLAGGVKAITAGLSHTCALMASGTVQCWGYNVYGQLGDGTTKTRSAPVPVAGLSGRVQSIAAGYYHTCALLDSGGVQCWGYNTSGQLGDGALTNSPLPVTVATLSGAKRISAGSDHACALLNSGSVQCWGANGSGQLGDGALTNSPLPVAVTGLAGAVTAISAGANHTCVLLGAALAQCWGQNSSGQLGDGTLTTRSAPVAISGLAGSLKGMVAGWNQTCVVLLTTVVQCWGDNTLGQLGQGVAGYSSIPVEVVATPPPPPLTAISPARGRNDLPVRVLIQGQGFVPGAAAQLEPGPAALENVLVLSSTALLATIPAGLAPGSYNLLVSNLNSGASTLINAYTALDATNSDVNKRVDDLYAFSLDLGLEPTMARFPANAPAKLRLTLRRLGGATSLGGVQVDFYQSDPTSPQDRVWIGSGTVENLLSDSVATSTAVLWDIPRVGDFILYAVIDRFNFVPELDEGNNTVQRQITVLPGLADDMAPVVESVTVNEGAVFTSSRAVTLKTTATDVGMGVSHLLFIEYVFNQALNIWQPVRVTPWMPYATAASMFWVLDLTPGTHYLQSWASDRAGNVSFEGPLALINYMPFEDFLSAGEVRVYRRPFTTPQTVNLTLSSAGSADLYVWYPDGASAAQSLGAPSPQTVHFLASQNGIYEYDVEARVSTNFSLGEQLGAAFVEQEESLHPRQSPYSNSAPPADGVGLPPAPVKIYRTSLPMLSR